mmetsp:Transcript_51143/g.121543  ORF Transcript_51143/g.121543 Transcript_51143/m.121543 type:complete len:297 (-) Transcript_51143:46-936(-)
MQLDEGQSGASVVSLPWEAELHALVERRFNQNVRCARHARGSFIIEADLSSLLDRQERTVTLMVLVPPSYPNVVPDVAAIDRGGILSIESMEQLRSYAAAAAEAGRAAGVAILSAVECGFWWAGMEAAKVAAASERVTNTTAVRGLLAERSRLQAENRWLREEADRLGVDRANWAIPRVEGPFSGTATPEALDLIITAVERDEAEDTPRASGGRILENAGFAPQQVPLADAPSGAPDPPAAPADCLPVASQLLAPERAPAELPAAGPPPGTPCSQSSSSDAHTYLEQAFDALGKQS